MTNSTLSLFVTAASPVIQAGILAAAGAAMAWKGTLNKNGCSVLAQLCFFLFTPALTFSTLARSISLDSIRHLWPLFANMTLSAIVGLIVGYFSSFLLNAPREFRGLIIAAIAFGNVGNLPLVFVGALCGDRQGIFYTILGEECTTVGTAYVAFDICIATVFQFTLAMYLLRPPVASHHGNKTNSTSNDADDADEYHHQIPLIQQQAIVSPLVLERHAVENKNSASVELQPLQQQHTTTSSAHHTHNRHHHTFPQSPLAPPNIATPSSIIPMNNNSNDDTTNKNRVISILKSIEWNMLFPLPTQAALLGAFVGCIPFLRNMLYHKASSSQGTIPSLQGQDQQQKEPILYVLGSALDFLGQGLVPSAIPLLGAVIYQGPGSSSKLSNKAIFGVLCIRLVLQPIVLTLVVVLFMHFEIFKAPDPMFWMMLFVSNATPTAINMQTMTVLYKFGAGEMSMLLFWQYIACVVTMPCFMWMFLQIINYYI